MRRARYSSLYQVNTRVWLTDLSSTLGRPSTLDDVLDVELDRLAERGFEWIWLLSVWQTGSVGRNVSRTNPEWRKEFEDTLPDLRDEDIAGSGFAITGYNVHGSLGGDAALARLREKLRKRGLRLMLDFVPNHTAIDHPWVESNPEYDITGNQGDLERAPQNYTRVRRTGDEMILAYGRDPYFAGWPDTLQLDYANRTTQDAMIAALVKIAGQCDGVRCDMAMLVLPDVFERTWGRRPEPFWPRATATVRQRVPGFCFMAEVYWDLEWTMQHQGFDFAYDKRLYDRLRDGHARPVREHFLAGLDYQDKLARFLENHDEPRAAATFPREVHEAAAVITFVAPGLRFFHQGEFGGRKKRISPHLVRGPVERARRGAARVLRSAAVCAQASCVSGGRLAAAAVPAGVGRQRDLGRLSGIWLADRTGPDAARDRELRTYAGQCYVPLPFAHLAGRSVQLSDLMSEASYDRDGTEITSRGLYLDLGPWGYHVFDVVPR